MGLENDLVFFLCEFLFVDYGVELIEVPFSTLFAGAIGNVFGDGGPVADAFGLDEDLEEVVLVLSPSAFEFEGFGDGFGDFGDLGGRIAVG